MEDLFATMAATHADFTDTFVALTDLVSDLSHSSSGSSSSGSKGNGNGVSSDRETKSVAGEDSSTTATASAKCLGKLVSRCASPKELEDMLRRKMKIHRLGNQHLDLPRPDMNSLTKYSPTLLHIL